MMHQHVIKLLRYHMWAQAVFCAHLRSLPEALYTQVSSSSFPSVHETFVHMYVVDSGWFSLLSDPGYQPSRETYLAFLAKTEGKDLAGMEALFLQLHQRLLAFMESGDPAKELLYGGGVFTHADVIQHIVNHGSYHRGNITTILRQLGQPGVATDYSKFVYGQP